MTLRDWFELAFATYGLLCLADRIELWLTKKKKDV
jgi:hypothetical protein